MASMPKHICTPVITTLSFIYVSAKATHTGKYIIYMQYMCFRTLSVKMKEGPKVYFTCGSY